MFDTRNDLPAGKRPNFFALHELFDKLAESVEDHIDELAAFGAKVRAAIDATDKLGDADTADLFTGISRESDKYLWFLEAHLHARR